jgi:hypothetical protein
MSGVDIKGFALQMTPEQVQDRMAALKAQDPQAEISGGHADCESEALARLRGQSPQPTCQSTLLIYTSDYSLHVDFIEDFPSHPGVSRAYTIQLLQSNLNTTADQRAFRDLVLSKYGRPSYVDNSGMEMWYCPVTSARPHCSQSWNNFGDEPNAFPDLWVVVGNPSHVQLSDWRYHSIRQRAIGKAIEQSNTHRTTL